MEIEVFDLTEAQSQSQGDEFDDDNGFEIVQTYSSKKEKPPVISLLEDSQEGEGSSSEGSIVEIIDDSNDGYGEAVNVEQPERPRDSSSSSTSSSLVTCARLVHLLDDVEPRKGGSQEEVRVADLTDETVFNNLLPGSSSSSSSSSSAGQQRARFGQKTETDIKQVISGDDDVDEETKALLIQIVEEEEAARAAELKNERLMLSLLEEEREERQKELDSQKYTCCICLDDEVLLQDMITLSCEPVGHRLCRNCFAGYCESKIKDAEVGADKLICPHVGCKTSISVHEIKSGVSAEIFEKYERFTMTAFGKERDDCRFCPKCNVWFAEVPQGDEDEVIWRKVSCGDESCGHSFCGRCGQKPHSGQVDQDITCEEYAKWQKANETVDEDFKKFISSAGIVKCPKCGEGGSLSGGCKFIYCRCGQRYCYLCQAMLEEKNHYTHFQGTAADGRKCTGPFGELCKGHGDPDIKINQGRAGRAASLPPMLPVARPPAVKRNLPLPKPRAKKARKKWK